MARYEQLRHHVLRGGDSNQPIGLALFLDQGMAGWIRSWQQHTPRQPESPVSPPLVKDVDGTLSQELVTAFVNMLFHMAGGNQA